MLFVVVRLLDFEHLICHVYFFFFYSESESELFTGDTSKDNHSPGPVVRGVSP